MKSFISVDISEKVKNEIKEIQDELPEFGGKKTELENLHLTLKFLGHLDNEKVNEVREKLKAIKFRKFETEFKHIGFFDNQKYGVIWIHLNNCNALQKEIDNCLKNLFKKEKRFMAHLTIARFKNVLDKKKFLNDLKKIEIPKTKFVVDNFRLKESVLTGNRPFYKTLWEYGLY